MSSAAISATQAITNNKKLRKTGNKVIAVNRLAESKGDGRVLLQLKWVFDPRLNPREMGLDEEAEWAKRLGVRASRRRARRPCYGAKLWRRRRLQECASYHGRHERRACDAP